MTGPAWHRLTWVILLALTVVGLGCKGLGGNSETDAMDELRGDAPDPGTYVGDHCLISPASLQRVRLYGVGLVNGLDFTGGMAPPGAQRKDFLKWLQNKNIPKPSKLIDGPQTSLVELIAYLPPGVRKKDRIDVQVRVVRHAKTRSLQRGWLMRAPLGEQARPEVRTIPISTKTRMSAIGPVFIDPFVAADGTGRQRLRGVVLGGGVSTAERDLLLLLGDDSRGVRMSRHIGNRINQRFYLMQAGGGTDGFANPLDDFRIEMKIPDIYRHNLSRLDQVVRAISMSDDPKDRADRINRLISQLDDAKPAKAQEAAFKLEAIGLDAEEALLKALDNGTPLAQLLAAETLAFLQNDAGVPILAQSLRGGTPEEQFRVVKAMECVNTPQSRLVLRSCLSLKPLRIRLAAFEALHRLDSPALSGKLLKDQFHLYVIADPRRPLVYVRRRHRAQIVLFGAETRLLPPILIDLGEFIIRADEDDTQCYVTRFQSLRDGRGRVIEPRTTRAPCPLELRQIITKMANMGATYGQVLAMLDRAKKHRNLMTDFVVEGLNEPDTARPEGAGAEPGIETPEPAE